MSSSIQSLFETYKTIKVGFGIKLLLRVVQVYIYKYIKLPTYNIILYAMTARW